MFNIRAGGEIAERHTRIEVALRAAVALKRVTHAPAVTLHDETSSREWSVGPKGTIRPGASSLVELRHGVAE